MSTMMIQEIPKMDSGFVHEAVRQQAKLHPDKLALIDEAGHGIDYQELAGRSARLARRLRSLGVRPDDRVAVWMDRSVELIVSMLAILEAGGAYVPIDTSYPKERVAVMLDSSGAVVLITDLEPPVASPGLTILKPGDADTEVADAAEIEATEIEAELNPDNLAYVIYTSGSTGAPKGVAMSHRGLTRLIRWQVEDGTPGLSTLQFTPICFDVSFQEVFSTLCTGGTLLLISDALRRDTDRLLVALKERSIQRLFLPYVALQQLAKASRRLRVVPHTLQHVITAGERLIVTEAIAEFFDALPGCRLDNHYGPTEAHLVTSYTLTQEPADWPSLPSIGAAVGGVTLYNLNNRLAAVPPGEVGELYVGGSGVARGYLNAPDLTAERFLPDPFSFAKGARMYRTGDVVEIDADGIVDFVGRSDDQIKVRGFRVEPGEVELALTDHPQVRQAAVGLRTIAADVPALVGYVATDGTSLSISDLSRHVRASLPDYMVPSRFVFLDSLPLTPSGKVDQRFLSEVEIPSINTEPLTESDSLIDTVRAIWERVLGHDELEMDDDFFDVGGDSLLATWVVTELSNALGREIELSVLLQDSTMAGIAQTLEGLALHPTGARQTSEVITLRPGPSKRALFLVHPLGGELLAYRALARSIKSPLRVLGLRWQPEEAQSALAMSMEDMAAVHLAQMRLIQPTGPYLLGGWSFGGVLAFELAQQIIASGERVDFLGLFDANPVLDPTTGLITRDSPLFGRLTKVLADIDRKLEAGEEADDLSELLADPYLGGLLGNTIPEGVTATHIRKNLNITRDNIWAAINYRAAPYSGAIDLFQPEGSPSMTQQSLAAELRKLARGAFRTHSVPGDHYGMLRAPLVETMAKAVDSALQAITHD
jgi:amino acid adenylation domain-containing protein